MMSTKERKQLFALFFSRANSRGDGSMSDMNCSAKQKGMSARVASRSTLMIILGLAVLTLILFWEVQDYEFLIWDDYEYVVANPHVRSGLSRESLVWAFSGSSFTYRHPLAWLSHMLDCELYGLNPRGHHFNGLLFHLFNALLLFIALYRMTGERWKSAFVAALFSIHPLRIESVAWVTERKDVLGAFFWLLTLLAYHFYTREPRIRRYLLLQGCFLLGLLSKPSLVTLPFVLLLLDYWPLGRIRLGRALHPTPHDLPRQYPLRLLLLEKFPFFLFSAAASIVTFWDADRIGSIAPADALSFGTRVGNAVISYLKYIFKMIWPADLAFFYPFPQDSWPLWQVFSALLLLCFVSTLVVWQGKRRPYLLVGWFWFLGALFPMIGIVQVGVQAMADRFTYLPHVGLSIAAIWLAAEFASHLRRSEIWLPIVSCLVLALFALSTSKQLPYWKDGTALFTRALEVTSGNYVAHYQMGCEYMRGRKTEPAIDHFSEAVRLRPDHYLSHHNLGLALATQGNLEESLIHLSTTLRLRPRSADVLTAIGDVYMMQGRLEQAISSYAEALTMNPALWKVHNNMGLALLRKKMAPEAANHFREALRLNPGDWKARSNLDIALEKIDEESETLR
ncbi:MAG: tetratricopeptide repeat protein [Desulfobacteraceae bacterium]|nr:MAG: tetratricopeptide repeat protein [Desulfobacteraceae bacterium]